VANAIVIAGSGRGSFTQAMPVSN